MAATLDALAEPGGRRFRYPGLRCRTCQHPTDQLKRGRCHACFGYWHKYGRERPPELWHRDFTGRRAISTGLRGPRLAGPPVAQDNGEPDPAA
jgi:hypothetical protein